MVQAPPGMQCFPYLLFSSLRHGIYRLVALRSAAENKRNEYCYVLRKTISYPLAFTHRLPPRVLYKVLCLGSHCIFSGICAPSRMRRISSPYSL
jgi:hypothetical protein